MNSVSIADYLKLKKILEYLEVQKFEKLRENNGFATRDTENLTEMLAGLEGIIDKLEKE